MSLLQVLGRWIVASGLGLCAALSALAQAPAPQASTVVPLQAFFKAPFMSGARLSPSGRWLAAMAALGNGRIGLAFVDLEGKEQVRFSQVSSDDDVTWFRWIDDDWLIYSVYNPSYRGASYDYGGLSAMKRDGSVSRALIAREWEPDTGGARRYLDFFHFYMAPGTPGTREIIVGEIKLDIRREFSHVTPKVLNIETGAVRTMLDKAPRADEWWFDAKGRARVASSTKDGRTTLYWADAATGEWRQLSDTPRFQQRFTPQYVEGDDSLIVDAANAEGSLDLRRFDFAAGAPGPDSILKTPGFSGNVDVYQTRPSGEVQGLLVDVDATTTVWFSPEMAKLQAAVDAKIPGYVNVLQCAPSCQSPKVVLVSSYAGNDPGYYLIYRPAENKWQVLGAKRPDIKASEMAALKFHRIKARDGEDLPVWITLPRQSPGMASKPAAAVVLVHGGPQSRSGTWGWREESQFLASRGYVVIEPEFRGSTGYGVKHFRAGWKQWGLAMQDDVSDALKFAVDSGWVDPGRVCIMGGSYGGYAALMGVVKDPDQYRCAVAFAAVSDPRFMYEFHWSDLSTEGRKYSLPLTLGDPKADAALLAAASPLEHAARIKAPILLVHGKIDYRVPIQNSERMLDALRKLGKTVDWVPYTDEGHGFSRQENEFDYYGRVEAFLAKYLKP